MRYLTITIIVMMLLPAGCRKKEPPRPKSQPSAAQTTRFRKPILISNIGARTITTLTIFYNDEGIIIHNLRPTAAVERVMLTNQPRVQMQFFITYADGKQSVVPKHYWSYTPGQLSGIQITGDGRALYK